LGVDVGTVQSKAERGLAQPDKLLTDIDAFAKAGKVGIGGMVIDSDSRILYFVNLFDKQVYAVDISDLDAPTIIDQVAASVGDNQQAFALSLHQGELYIGSNDTGAQGFES